MKAAKKKAPFDGVEKPSARDIEGVMESILHATKMHGADPQQYVRAAGFALGYWGAKKMEPKDLAPEHFDDGTRSKRSGLGVDVMQRAHDTGYRVGRWLRSLAAKEGR